MKRNSILFVLCFLQSTIWALAPGTSASLRKHLEEVNVEWIHHSGKLTDSKEVSFSSEAERIQAHLYEVIRILRMSSSIGGGQKTQRGKVIAQLAAYADFGVFPENHISEVRTPVFIDARNVHCAVGYLMSVNGFSELANAVSSCNNTVYLREIPISRLEKWMAFSGLSVDEMALIQPTYPPPYVWNNEGYDFSGTVRDMVEFDGEIYVTGNLYFDFIQCALAKRSGDFFIPIIGLEGNGNELEVYEGKLYVAGTFSGYDVVVLDTSDNWSYIQVSTSKIPEGRTLLAAYGKLYLAGDASGFAPMSGVWEFDGTTWTEIGTGPAPTYTLFQYNNRIVAAGEPGNIYGSDYEELSVAAWNGAEWTQLGEGFPQRIKGLIEINDTLFACGPVSEYGEIRYGFAWYRNGEWDSVSPDTWDSYFSVPLNEELTYSFEGFYKIGSSYYIHGRMRFSGLTIGIVGSGIYPFAPVTDPVFSEPWWFYSPLMPTLPTNTTVYCAYYNDGTLWVGGDFYDDAYPNLNLIASTENFAVGTDEIIPGLRPVLYPNPGNGRFHITSHAGNSEFNNETEYQLIGLTGQLIERGKVHAGAGGEAVIDLTHQPSGLYHLNVFGTSGTLQFKVIVE
jgi:hypothetical protein